MRRSIHAEMLACALLCVDPQKKVYLARGLQRLFFRFARQHKNAFPVTGWKTGDRRKQVAALNIGRMAIKGRCRSPAFRLGVCEGQELRFCLRSSSHVWPPVLIQFDASSSEDASKISSEWVPSSVAQTDHTGPLGAFLMINAGPSWVVGALSKISVIPSNMALDVA